MRWIVAVVMLAAPGAVIAQERQQFDLVCTAKGSSVRYRIDLAGKRYCGGNCAKVSDIVEVTPSRIILVRHEPQFPSDYTDRTEIDRSTGEWYNYLDNPPSIPFVEKGVCQPAPFSGLPAAKF